MIKDILKHLFQVIAYIYIYIALTTQVVCRNVFSDAGRSLALFRLKNYLEILEIMRVRAGSRGRR